MLGAVALMAACTEDYSDEWAVPMKGDTPASSTEVTQGGDSKITVTPVEGVINFADFAAEQTTVKLCTVNAPAPKDTTIKQDDYIVLDSAATFQLVDGTVTVDELKGYLEGKYGMAPVERTINAYVYTTYTSATMKTRSFSDAFELKAQLKAPIIESAYYFTGSINDWNNNDVTYKLTNDGSDPYANPTFTCRIPAPDDGSNVEFKMTPESGLGGDWSGCLAAGETEGTFVYNNAGGNLVITAVAGAKFYDLTFNMLDLTWSYQAVKFNPFVYFIGATDGWAGADQKLALADESGVYTGFVYVADPNNWGLEFKFQRVAGSWDNEINSGTFTNGITGGFADGGGNIKATEGEGVYYVTLDLGEAKLDATKIEYMGITGDYCGWNEGAQMTWNATDYCFELTGAGVTANGWKFRANGLTDPNWTINLGGELNDLTQGGANISTVGTIIKLYPTRKTSDKIYCTVE